MKAKFKLTGVLSLIGLYCISIPAIGQEVQFRGTQEGDEKKQERKKYTLPPIPFEPRVPKKKPEPPPKPPRNEVLAKFDAGLDLLLVKMANLQANIIEVHCIECAVELREKGKDRAAFRHITGRFVLMRNHLWAIRDELGKLETPNPKVQAEMRVLLAKYKARLELVEPLIKRLEKGPNDPKLKAVKSALAAFEKEFGDAKAPSVSRQALLQEDVETLSKAVSRLSSQRRRFVTRKEGAILDAIDNVEKRLEKLKKAVQSKDAAELAWAYTELVEIHDLIRPHYLQLDILTDKFLPVEGARKDHESYNAIIAFMGASEYFSLYSKQWGTEQFASISHDRFSQAVKEAKGGKDKESKFFALIFYSKESPFRPNAKSVYELRDLSIAYLPEDYPYEYEEGKTMRLIDHAAFEDLKGKPGILIVNLKEPKSESYQQVVSFVTSRNWNSPSALRSAVVQAARNSKPEEGTEKIKQQRQDNEGSNEDKKQENNDDKDNENEEQ